MAKPQARFEISATDRTKSTFRGVSRNLKKLNSDIAFLKTAMGGLGLAAVGGLAVRSFIEQEKTLNILEARLKSTGGIAGKTADDIKNLADELENVTNFSDDTILGMENLLLTFTNIRGVIFDETVPVVLDLAEALGTSLQSAATQVGKALNDPILGVSALAEAGIQFTVAQKEMIKSLVEGGKTASAQQIILKELEVQFGGTAEAAAEGLGGGLKGLKNAVVDLGQAVVELVTAGGDSSFVAWATGMVRFITDEVIPAFDFWIKRLGLIKLEIKEMELPDLMVRFDDLTLAVEKATEATDKDAESLSTLAANIKSATVVGLPNAIKKFDTVRNSIHDARIEQEKMRQELREVAEAMKAIEESTIEDIYRGMETQINSTTAAITALNNEIGGGTVTEQPEFDFENEREVARQDALNELIRTRQEEHEEKMMNIKLMHAHMQMGALRLIGEQQVKWTMEQSKSVLGFMASQTAGVAQQNRTLFEINKVAGIANAIIFAHESAAAAYKAYAAYPPVAAAMAALAYAAGIARVQAIRSTSFGGGGAAPSTGGGGGGGAGPPVDVIEQDPILASSVAAEQGGGGSNVNVTINVGDGAAIIGADLEEIIRDAVEGAIDRDALVVNSRAVRENT